jgi:hypothetical protein
MPSPWIQFTTAAGRIAADFSDSRIRADDGDMELLKTLSLFAITALAESVGCYLRYLRLKQERSPWLLLPAAVTAPTSATPV